ncbi:unnamed protein product [Adineta steineri]|uniref:Transcription factor BTF3 n=1 Tax=Adineta steineri TaxID=433720 RepID=A0A814H715_9BILA|nr:unnamed protein product [Adineta steineri]
MSSAQTTTSTTDAAPVFQVNQKKLKELAESANAIKIGGKGTARRKKKIIHRPANADDKKLQSSLKKLTTNNIQGIEEVNMFKDNGEVIHFANPKVQASLGSNTFAISGPSDTKSLQDMLPTIMSQMGMSTDSVLASELGRRRGGSHGEQQTGDGTTNEQTGAEGDDDVPGNMHAFCTIFLFILYCTFTNSIDTNKSSSKLIAKLNQRSVILNKEINRLYKNNHTNKNYLSSEKSHRQLFNERLIIVIIIISISIGIMIVIVVTVITIRYRRTGPRHTSATPEQKMSLTNSI